jgi:S1-C subfamily serine protease
MRKSVFAISLLLAGFLSGLIISGRLDVTGLSTAAPPVVDQTPAGAAVPAATTVELPATLPNLSSIAESALRVSANISSTTIVNPDPFFQLFYGARAQRSQSLGSGVVVSPDGYILTNTHVIGNARAEILVTLPDGQERPARIVGIDRLSDLGVVKIDAEDLPTLAWGDSSKLRVAEWVLAIGNPFQLSGTVTLGIVSTVTRPGEQFGQVEAFIQTDAAINPGNSGGALVSARGELVGINTMIVSETGGSAGVGLAIPSNRARQIMTELIEHGAVSWGSIGTESMNALMVNAATARRYGLPATGLLVRALYSNSSAYRAGLRPGDTIRRVNGEPITSPNQLNLLVIRQKVGATIRLDVVKEDGRELTLDVPVVPRDDSNGRQQLR